MGQKAGGILPCSQPLAVRRVARKSRNHESIELHESRSRQTARFLIRAFRAIRGYSPFRYLRPSATSAAKKATPIPRRPKTAFSQRATARFFCG